MLIKLNFMGELKEVVTYNNILLWKNFKFIEMLKELSVEYLCFVEIV